MTDVPDQELPDQGGDDGEEVPPEGEDGEEGEGEDDGEEGDPVAPPLATGPVLADHVDVPSLGGPVGAGQVDAITTADEEAKAAAQEAEPS